MPDFPVLEHDDYLARLLALPRPGAEKVLAFYEHRVGAICKDVRLMLLPLDDHLLHRGDGVFESLKYVGRKLYQLDAHMERMKKSAASISLTPPCAWEEVREACIAVAKAGGADTGMLRILLGRGPGGFAIDPFESPRASLYIAAYQFTPKPEGYFAKGVTAFRTGTPAKQSWLAKIKSVNYLPNVLMKMEAVEKGYDYPFCFDEHGFLAEGATENVALVDQNGALVVPEFTHSLPGTTLLRAIDLIKGEVSVTFRGVTEADVYGAREVLILGTTGDCIPVVRYEGKPIHDVRPGPVAQRLRQLILRDLEENGVRF
jgi:branched-chain amino acid aminotransferase